MADFLMGAFLLVNGVFVILAKRLAASSETKVREAFTSRRRQQLLEKAFNEIRIIRWPGYLLSMSFLAVSLWLGIRNGWNRTSVTLLCFGVVIGLVAQSWESWVYWRLQLNAPKQGLSRAVLIHFLAHLAIKISGTSLLIYICFTRF